MKLRLEPVEYKHLKWLRDQRNQRELQDFCRQPFLLNEVMQEDWLKDVSKNKTMVPFIVVDKDLKEGADWVGYAAFSNIDWIARRAEISYFTSIEHKAKGYCLMAIPLVLEYGFRRLGFQKIHTDTFAFNLKELEIMKLLGFHEEGKLERHYYKRGLLHDSIPIALFIEDFKCPDIEEAASKPL